MRRSICFCEPAQALAGEANTWNFIYTTAVALPKGAKLRFDLMSEGRDIDWQIPSTSSKKSSNVIYGKLDNGKTVDAKEVEIPNRYTPLYEFELPVKIEAGANFTIVVGAPKGTAKGSLLKSGTQTQTYAQRRRSFLLYIDTSGKGQFSDPEVFTMDIRGNELFSIKVLTPSYVIRNKRFDVIVRFEDEFGNLTSKTPEETLIELSYENLRENLSWKLFVPETGFITLPNLYFNEVGTYTIQLLNTHTNEIFRSAPIRCYQENEKTLFWGLLHGESERIDSTENIESCLRHFRDEKSLNYFSTSSFEDVEETPADLWKLISQNVDEFDETDRFVTFLGFQWPGAKGTEGVRHIIYAKDNKPLLRKKDAKSTTLKKMYKSSAPKEFISIPTFTMGKGFEFNFEDYSPEFERVVEIYNSWGCSERTAKEGNLRPITGPSKKGVGETAEGSIINALKKNLRFGFVAGGMDDRGIYGNFFENDQEQYSPGMTAILSPEHSRASLFEALYNRCCYATTGPRIIIDFSLAGTPMGGEVSTADKHGLMINRHLAGHVAGTTDLATVEIVRNGKVIHTYKPTGYSLDFEYDDLTSLEAACLTVDKKPPFCFYYIRVTQKDGNMGWSSPIWVDCVKGKPIKKDPRLLSKSSKKTAPILEDFNLDEDEDDE